MRIHGNQNSQNLSSLRAVLYLLPPHPSLLNHLMMTSSHQSHNTTSFKPRRLKPTGHINQNEPSSQPILKCPRCNSINTKFCYYNNYSLSQPRHYCKNCRRYWTRGGALRNVPIGGSTRNKNKTCNLHVISSLPPPPPSNVTSLVDRFRLNTPSTAMMMSSGGFSNGYMFPLDPSYNLAPSSSIECLSSLNQYLHQKLQQQRLTTTSMFLQDSLPVNDKPEELLPPSTNWMLDRSTMGGAGASSGNNEDNGNGESTLRIWYNNANNSLP